MSNPEKGQILTANRLRDGEVVFLTLQWTFLVLLAILLVRRQRRRT